MLRCYPKDLRRHRSVMCNPSASPSVWQTASRKNTAVLTAHMVASEVRFRSPRSDKRHRPHPCTIFPTLIHPISNRLRKPSCIWCSRTQGSNAEFPIWWASSRANLSLASNRKIVGQPGSDQNWWRGSSNSIRVNVSVGYLNWMRFLNMDAPILHRLDGIGEFQQLAGGGIGIGEGARVYEFLRPRHHDLERVIRQRPLQRLVQLLLTMGWLTSWGWLTSCTLSLGEFLHRTRRSHWLKERDHWWAGGHREAAASNPCNAQSHLRPLETPSPFYPELSLHP